MPTNTETLLPEALKSLSSLIHVLGQENIAPLLFELELDALRKAKITAAALKKRR